MHHALEDRGINLNGILMKSKYGEVLLAACFKNSKNEIQIVSVTGLSGKTQNNQSWFRHFFQTL